MNFFALPNNHGIHITGPSSIAKYPLNAIKLPIDIFPFITKFEPYSNVIAYANPNPKLTHTNNKF